ncbi:DEAD/DEAH box helicase family protein [Chitinophaga sp. OAE865]|uniref:type I restriction endonuclease subunit R n=1 Tax=Chitinophaga sp. OAE865 TaxID=2817898 RepID=UPI001AE24D3C
MKSEKQTRKELIDLRLAEAGWNTADRVQVVEEFFVTSLSNELNEPAVSYNTFFSDYALLGKDGKPLAVVEAKKTSVDAEIGREQAKQYCHQIRETQKVELPFCFYTNGYDIYFWDLENYPPRKVHGFPTREDLIRYRNLKQSRRSLQGELINTKIAGRDYQQKAIRAVLEAVEKCKRKFLLVMATGTGKTRTCIALIESLMRAGRVERVLFLVDRVALRDQTLDAFKEHLPNEPRWPKIGEKLIAKDRRIYVSTYPTMLNIIRDKNFELSPHFFDLVIVDESHRSIYNTYQEILNYFDAITLGLTATPTNVIDHNTFQLFDCEDGLPTYAYSYEEAVNNIPHFLCNFQVMKLKTKFQEEGINKRTISLEDQKKLILEGKEIAEINFEGTELEKTVSNRGTNALIIKSFMEECIKDDNGVLPGKTIFFCVSKRHAREVERIFDQLYPEYKGELAKVIVSDDPRTYGKGGLLDQFTNNDFPRVAISVDMLDTGIDIRELVNLVFAKPVYSYTKFWQMIGRGTRLLENEKIKPWCAQKDAFLIMDCWDNFEYFKLNPKGKELKTQVPLPVRLFGLRLDKIEKALELSKSDTISRETKKLRAQISELPAHSVVIIEAQKDLGEVADAMYWDQLSLDKIDFLRQHIKPLLRTLSGKDFKAMRFEKDIVEVSLTQLNENWEKFETLKEAIVEEIATLPLSINIVAREENFIQQVQKNNYWAAMDEDKYDELITRLSPLMHFIDNSDPSSRTVQLNLKDIITQKEFVEFGPQHESVSISRYREMVESKINELLVSNHILQKIKQGENITEEETIRLAIELHEEHPNITLDLLRRVYNHRKARLQHFIKHILGVESLQSFPETVSQSFQQFLNEHSYLSSRQLQFLDMLKTFIIERGDLQKKNLIETPFTMIHPDGIRGIFGTKEIEEILQMTQKLLAA